MKHTPGGIHTRWRICRVEDIMKHTRGGIHARWRICRVEDIILYDRDLDERI